MLVDKTLADATKGKKLVDFLHWALTDGEKDAPALEYAPLPQSLDTRLVARLDSIKVGASGM